jgi:predicted Zn-dependent protease
VLWQSGELEHRRRLAWAELAGGQSDDCRRTLRRLYEGCRGRGDLAAWFPLSAALAAGLHATPTAGVGVWPAAAESLLRREEARRASVVVRTAALLPDAVEPAGLLTLAQRAVEADPQGWQARELLGAALYRAGQPEDAVRALDEAVHLQGADGSVWAKLFLALAHQRLGHAHEVKRWRDKAQKTSGWAEAVIQRQLFSELDGPRPAAGW